MKETDITICGHGSGKPSLKNMQVYCENRYHQHAMNGKDKGLACVVRFLETGEQRTRFAALYNTLLGRNIYSQNDRGYVYTPKADGNYYSDCSSSGCHTYDKVGVKDVKYLNTAGMYYAGTKVAVRIQCGHIVEEDLKLLKVGDALLFRGNDPSRPQQIGHVEYVFKMPTENGWIQNEDDTWSYLKENGSYAESEWLKVNHHWYVFDNKGVMLTGWAHLDGQWFYLEESGDFEGACWHETEKKNGSLERWYVD